MERKQLTVISNRAVNAAGNVYRMELGGCESLQRPGQFVDIALDGLYLRRPISICDWHDGVLTLLYKVVGKGTAMMASMAEGTLIDVLTGLGNGYTLPDALTTGEASVRSPLLVGGGIGTAPLYLLARRLLQQGLVPTVILGFNNFDEIVLEDEFKALGVRTLVTTADGSYGIHGFVTDALQTLSANVTTAADGYDYCYVCGPMPMMRALAPLLKCPSQFSLEERMGCGTGICMGCTCPQLTGSKRICKDGPVFRLEEINFQ